MSEVPPTHAFNPAAQNCVYEVKGLAKSYDKGRIQALRGVNLTIREGEFLAILGPSGCGKTTLLQLLGTLEEQGAGTLAYRGRAVDTSFDSIHYRSRDVGFIFQMFHLLPTFTAIENVQMPMLEMSWSANERFDRASELLRSVGLGERMNQLPAELSGGERQRVAIARSLANRPSVLLMDEPTGNLDSDNAREIMELLNHIHRTQHLTILMVTHDPVIAKNATREVHMCDGSIVSDTGNTGAYADKTAGGNAS